MFAGTKCKRVSLAWIIDGSIWCFGVSIPQEPGLRVLAARRRMQSFIDLVAADGLRFGNASAGLAKAGFSPAGEQVGAMIHRDGETSAMIVLSESRPSLCMRFSPSAWPGLILDFEAMFQKTLNAPLRRLGEGRSGERVYAAKIAGREIRLEFASTSFDGLRRVYLFARPLDARDATKRICAPAGRLRRKAEAA